MDIHIMDIDMNMKMDMVWDRDMDRKCYSLWSSLRLRRGETIDTGIKIGISLRLVLRLGLSYS